MVRFGDSLRVAMVTVIASAILGAGVGQAQTTSSGTQSTASQASTAGGATARAAMLDDLLLRLHRCSDAQEASQLEDRIFELWSKSGDAEADSIFSQGLAALAYRDYPRAQSLFEQATQRAPDYVEAWNKLASVHYLQGDLSEALRDADHTLMLERRHYGALAGRGMVLAALGDERGALTSFEMALAVNPASPSLKQNVERLRDRLGYRIAD
jgi:tetratricopeptide (TPR) repeat protein